MTDFPKRSSGMTLSHKPCETWVPQPNWTPICGVSYSVCSRCGWIFSHHRFPALPNRGIRASGKELWDIMMLDKEERCERYREFLGERPSEG